MKRNDFNFTTANLERLICYYTQSCANPIYIEQVLCGQDVAKPGKKVVMRRESRRIGSFLKH